MSKWCDTCYRNEVIGEWKSCDASCPMFGKHYEDIDKYIACIQERLEPLFKSAFEKVIERALINGMIYERYYNNTKTKE